MKYPYPSHRINEIVNAPKCVREGETFEVKTKGERGASFDVNLTLLDEGPFSDPRYLGGTHDLKHTASYRAAFLLGSQKVRGVDFHAVGQRQWYRQRIPPGWHQDMRDPNLPTTDTNHHRRAPLSNFAPVDFRDFIGRTAALWSIDLAWEESML